MNGKNVCRLVLALAAIAVPCSSAQACNWWRSCFGGAPTTTYYAPYTAAYAPAGCGQTVSYMPQTSYRTVYVNAPVVAYRPVVAADPCTGCATTVMRPVVSYVTQAQVVPYTTYRPVVMAARPCCGAAPVVANYAPVYAAVPAVTAAPAPCCGAAAAPGSIITSAPAGTPGAAVPSLSYPATNGGTTTFQSTPPQNGMPTPSLYPPSNANPPSGAYPPSAYPSNNVSQGSATPAPGTTPPAGSLTQPPQTAPENKTFQNPLEEKKPEPESRLLLPPRGEPTNSDGNRAMRGLDPESDQDRFTAIPLRQPYAVRPASLIVPAAQAARR